MRQPTARGLVKNRCRWQLPSIARRCLLINARQRNAAIIPLNDLLRAPAFERVVLRAALAHSRAVSPTRALENPGRDFLIGVASRRNDKR